MNPGFSSRIVFISVLLAVSSVSPAFGQQTPRAPVPDPHNDWKVTDPALAFTDDNPSSQDKMKFNEAQESDALDDFCRDVLALPIQAKFPVPDAAASYVTGDVNAQRGFYRYSDGGTAVLDRIKLTATGMFNPQIADVGTIGTIGVGFSATLQGESSVVQPISDWKGCNEVFRLINLTKVKTILPLTAKRLSEMAVSELWKVPVVFELRLGLPGVASTPIKAPILVSVSLKDQNKTSVSLYRISAKQLRFRIRLDYAVITTLEGSVLASVPIVFFGLPATESLLEPILGNTIAHIFNQGMFARFYAGWSRDLGRQVLLEYVLDPTDRDSMEALAGVLRGNLDLLEKVATLAVGSQAVKELWELQNGRMPPDHVVREMKRKTDAALHSASSFAGGQVYGRDEWRFHLHFPFFMDWVAVDAKRKDNIVLLERDDETYKIFRRERYRSAGTVDVGDWGKMFTTLKTQSAEAFTSRDENGVRAPMALFIKQDGFIRNTVGRARDSAVEADELMRLVGTRGRGDNLKTALPVEQIYPASLDAAVKSGRWLHLNFTTLTVAFTRAAIDDVVSAPLGDILAACVRSIESAWIRELVGGVLAQATLQDGKVEYDDALVPAPFNENPRDYSFERQQVRWVADQAQDFYAAFRKIRQARDPDAKANAFTKLMAGKGITGLAYYGVVKVLIQLTKPEHLWSEFYVQYETGKSNKPSLHARYELNGGHADLPAIKQMARNKERFAQPTQLKD